MPIQIQTSFVPKKTPLSTSSVSAGGGRSVNLLAIISLSIFFIIVGLSATVFFYKSSLVNSIMEMDALLAAAKKSFEPEFIDEAAKLNIRIEGARELLNSHRALSPLFDLLEKKTLENVRFQDFNFMAAEGKDATLSMLGQARSFNAVALQSDVFGAEKAFKDPVFSNFTLNESGDVIFNFRTTIAAELLHYRETVLGAADTTN
ncbi:MAG: hypothetical protein UY50_C0012G0006 [Parcubacteria group bacterium GW2011_GWA2_49_9]|nr:MAG: hypothetical protein UY50_C0012G0006 [Parcubacteria group bacterium GW2011_GWA2_49_9]